MFFLFLLNIATEIFLHHLLWMGCDLMRPNWCILNPTSGAGRHLATLDRRLAELERRQLIERRPTTDTRRVQRLTARGWEAAWGGQDPAARWARPWDGRWRLLVFDLPTLASGLRTRLRRLLLARRFGRLQQSVWLTPDPVPEFQARLHPLPANVGSLLLFEGQTGASEPDAALVCRAWDFSALNKRYAAHERWLKRCPAPARGDGGRSPALLGWTVQEFHAWRTALRGDPLLPRALQPPGYLGEKAWAARRTVYQRLAAALR